MVSLQQPLVGTIRDVLGADERVGAVYIYGSFARGRSTPLSDVDLAVVPRAGIGSAERGELLRLISLELGRRAPGRSFDVRLLDELPTAVGGRVISEGSLILERDPVSRVRAEVATRLAYHDFQYFEREGTRQGLVGLRRRLGLG